MVLPGFGLSRLMLALTAVGLLTIARGEARAAIIGPPPYSSRVDAAITLQPSGQFLYSFTVVNTSGFSAAQTGFFTPVIMDWELPFFSLSDFDTSSITSPAGWGYEIVTPYNADPSFWNYNAATDPLLDPNQGGDPNLYGPNPEVFNEPPYILHWVTDDPSQYGIFPGNSLSGFSFLSSYGPFNAPYLASWVDLPPRGGDPPTPEENAFSTPLSPARFAAQRFPEPGTLLLIGAGAAGLLLLRRRRPSGQAVVG
jgi:hypothetical protein